jgi:hypothetical protein
VIGSVALRAMPANINSITISPFILLFYRKLIPYARGECYEEVKKY